MESLLQLLYLLLYMYLGVFTQILYDILMGYQKKFLTIKALLIFIFVGYLWIAITNMYEISFRFIYFFFYVIGYIISHYIFHSYICDLLTLYKPYLLRFKDFILYLMHLILVPPILQYIKCKLYTMLYYHKHPWLKPIGIKRLF